ncbi:LipL21 lipoprotein [Leptospira kobayashii]|uniref:Lipoprotein LipL21 n=2 Tax=Leptospira TaxID=171 RepID=A0A4R9LR54_9LEPT|nr:MULTISPECIES: lipoprotein LipL21 [Leptospira]TGN10983.1 lipoprotein LipL21 [Leptospira ilyithenensis]BDA77079.1 LipL21 lipoprotein [Leptospira kobayashii]
MKKSLIVMASLVAFIVSCGGGDSRRDATTVGKNGWIFEGWACAPDAAAGKEGKSPAEYCKGKEKEFEYLYMKFSARASAKAINEKSIAMKKSTCREAARLQVAGDGLKKILGEYLEQASGVSDGQSTGSVIVSESKGKISGLGIYDCCSLNKDTGACAEVGEQESWEECDCVGYMRYAGGQKALETKAKEVQ